RTRREKAFDQDFLHFGPTQLGLDRAADDPAAAAEYRHRRDRIFSSALLELSGGEQSLLREPATVPEHVHLTLIELRSLGGERGGGVMSQCQVHIVAAQEN